MVLTPRHQGGHHGGGFGSSGADVGAGGASAGSYEHGSESEVMVVTGGASWGVDAQAELAEDVAERIRRRAVGERGADAEHGGNGVRIGWAERR